MATSHLCLLFLLALLHGSTMTQAKCGGTISLSVDGTKVLLTSPNYPSHHLHNMRCEWHISTSSTSGRDNATHIYTPRIMFMIVDMQLERNFYFGGCHDYLIFDSALRVCGTRNRRSLTYLSRTHSTSMLFVSDGSVSGRGFKLYVWAYLDCGGRRIINSQHPSGVINSPVFPDGAVPVDMVCRWEILDVFRKKIQLSLSDHGNTHCKNYDLIAVNQTRDVHQHLCTTNFSQSSWTAPVSRLYFFLVVPLSEISVKSFKLYYESSNVSVPTGTPAPPIDCSNLTYYVPPGESLTLRTPNYPDHYPHNLRCNIRVHTDQYARVPGSGGLIQVPWRLFFEAKDGMSLEYESVCRFDYLEINGVRYCRSYAERVGTTTTANRALVRFRTDESNSRPGFEFLVTAAKQICGQTSFYLDTSRVAYISTPNYPNFYTLDVNCTWTFYAIQVNGLSNYNVYVLAQNGYDIYPMSGCPLDYLTMNNGQRVCGTKRTAESWLIPVGSSIRFRSNVQGSYKGGNFSVQFIDTCGGVAQITSTNLRGSLNGPTFPAVAPSRYVCRYKFKNLRQNRAVKLGLNVEKSNSTDNGTDNGNSTSPCQTFQLVATIFETGATFVMCSPTVYLQNLTLASSEVEVELRVSGSQPTQPSFEIEYQDVPMPSPNVSDSLCGNRNIFVPQFYYYYLKSPGSPNYHHNLSCIWTLETYNTSRNSAYVFPRTAYSLLIRLQSYNIEDHPNCGWDYLRIQGSQPICGSGGERIFFIPNFVGSIFFKSDHSVNKNGFQISMKAVLSCGGMRTLNSVTSTAWLGPPYMYFSTYPADVKCTWYVESRDGWAVSVMPSRRDYQTVCTNYTLYAWSPTDSSRVIDLCLGRPSSSWAVQFGSRVVISFAMNPNIVHRHRPNVRVKVSRIPPPVTTTPGTPTTTPASPPDSRCGNRNIFVPSNRHLNSPGYPNNSHHNLSCTWTLETFNTTRNSTFVFPRTAYSLFIQLLSYRIKYHPNCKYGYLHIQGSPPICGTGPQRAILIPNSVGSISFKTDRSVNADGFQISIKSVPSCGGIVTLNSTTSTVLLSLPHFSTHISIYPADVKCTWYVERQDGLAIWVMPSRTDYQTTCATYTMHAWSPTNSSQFVDLCLGRPHIYWPVQFSSRVVINFAMRPNIAHRRRPNVSVKVSRIPPPITTTPTSTPKTTTKTPTTTTSPTTTTTKKPVVVPGTWSSWSPWAACSVTCGMGSKKRTRSCKGKHSGVFCVNKEGVKATKETETKNCFRPSCENASAKQKANAIKISFKISRKLTKDVFFDYVFDIVAKAFTTSINTFCNKKPGKCCKPGDTKSYTKTKSAMLTYTKDSSIRVDGKSLRITTTLISMSLFVQPPAKNDLCSNIKAATVKARKKRSTVADAKDPLSKTALQEAAKGINTTQMGTDISTNLKKNLNIDVKITVTINTQQPTSSPQNNKWKAPVAVFVSLLVAAAIGVAMFLIIRKLRHFDDEFKTLEEDTGDGYANPVYESFGIDSSTSRA